MIKGGDKVSVKAIVTELAVACSQISSFSQHTSLSPSCFFFTKLIKSKFSCVSFTRKILMNLRRYVDILDA